MIGKILRTRGNRGELVVSLSPGAVAPGEGSTVELRSSKRAYPQTIERISDAHGDAIVVFSGSHSIGEALRYVGCTVWADVPAPPEAEQGKSILGFRVFDRQGDCWGEITSQPRFSLNQLLEIRDPASGETVYVPWHESLVVSIDRRNRTMVIDPPAGLRDLNK